MPQRAQRWSYLHAWCKQGVLQATEQSCQPELGSLFWGTGLCPWNLASLSSLGEREAVCPPAHT